MWGGYGMRNRRLHMLASRRYLFNLLEQLGLMLMVKGVGVGDIDKGFLGF